mgnify:CR=1 FL=1
MNSSDGTTSAVSPTAACVRRSRMFAVIAADGNELIQNALLLIPLTSPIPLH